MTTRRIFGDQTAGALGIGFTQTHRDDQVEAALRGYFAPADLERLTKQIGAAADRRRRRGKFAGQLEVLARVVEGASRPPSTPVAMRWYAHPTGGSPLLVELLDGDQAGRTVMTVPPGAKWRFVGLEGVGDRVYCQPVDDQGDDLGERTWSIGAVSSAGTYLVPFDAIRTGDARDAPR